MPAQLSAFVHERALSNIDVLAADENGMREVLRMALEMAGQARAEQQQLRQQLASLQVSMDAVLRHLQLPNVGDVGDGQEAEQQE